MAFARTRTFFARFNPVGPVGDFIAVWREAGRARWVFFALALLTSFGAFSLVMFEEYRIVPRPPEIIWINSWRADRSDAEIRTSNIVNERQKRADAADQAKRDEEVRHIYKTIGRLSGMDVDAIERQAKAEQAASDARAQAEHELFMQRYGPKAETQPAPQPAPK